MFFVVQRLNLRVEASTEPESARAALKEAALYIWNTPRLLGCLSIFGVFGIFGWSYATIMPVIAKDILNLGPSGLGALFTAVGVGAICAGLWSGSSYMKLGSNQRMLYGAFIFSIGLACFALTEQYQPALLFLIIMGFGQILQNATLSSQIQLLAPEGMRGRVSSVQTFLTQGTRAIGSFGIGAIAEYSSAPFALYLCAIMIALSMLVVHNRFLKHTKVTI
jgi:predicted MFS family arabinose efflux permease